MLFRAARRAARPVRRPSRKPRLVLEGGLSTYDHLGFCIALALALFLCAIVSLIAFGTTTVQHEDDPFPWRNAPVTTRAAPPGSAP